MKSSRPAPPPKLSAEGKAWWTRIIGLYALDEPALLILESALECLGTMRDAQAVVKEKGMVVQDRFGQLKQNPATLIERDAKTNMLRHLKALNLDLEPLADRPGRPAGS
jgi:P27 family predicted phage terminase small subunit